MKNNQNYKSRLASLMVLCQLFLLSAVSCGETAVGNLASDDTDAVSGAGSTVESTVLDDKQRAYWEPLKSENMDGYTMNVAVTQELVFRPEEENGDLINDAIFLRNRNVEELYNIHLTETVTKTAAVQSAVLAGDDSYAVCMCPLYRDAANMATGNLLYDIGAIDTLDTEAVWWDQNLLNTTKIGGRQFFLAGDIDYTLYGRTIVLMFNKGKMTEITSDNIYDTVKAGKWTFDAFDKLQKNATRDLNGDSIMDENDSYGIIMSAVHASVLYSAAGERIVRNDGDAPVLAMNNARGADVIDKVFKITLGAADYCYNTDKVSQDGVWDRVLEMFRAEKALFQSTVLYNTIKQRSMESDFGILPYPKYDETQDKYYATSYNGNHVFVIPKTVKDVDKVGKIMNALAFEGRFTVKPAFYDQALGTKFIRDDESAEMLDIVFNNIIFDVGFMYNVGSLGDLIRNMHKAGNTNFASEYAAKSETAKTALADLVTKFSEMN